MRTSLSSPRVLTAAGLLVLLVLLILVSLLRPRATSLPVYYAAPTGTGDGSSATSPMRVDQFWALAQPGATLVLLDGTYGPIEAPAGLSGTPAQPITITAQHDGKVLVDAGGYFGVLIPGDWFVLEGINARHGGEKLWYLKGSHNRARRVIGWNGSAGQDDANIFSTGKGVDNVFEDCAGFGADSRKIFDGAQSPAPNAETGWSGYRRCWGMFQDWPGGTSQPTDTAQNGYRSRQQTWENNLFTTNVTGDRGDLEGVFTSFFDCDRSDNSLSGTRILGNIFYLPAAYTFPAGQLFSHWCASDTVMQDTIALVEHGAHQTVKPFWFGRMTGYPERNNVCQNCVSVHSGTPSSVDADTGWTFTPALREGRTVAEALGGASLWMTLPGLCTRYENGTLTSTPLWPWPMAGRIKEALALAGQEVVDVTAEVERLLGPIPEACKAGSTPIPPEPPTPDGAALTCTGEIRAVPGHLALRCVPETAKPRR